MKRKPNGTVTLTKVAKVAGVSKTAASFALQNKSGVSKGTRARVLEVAERLGYVPDARIASLMATIRDAQAKELLPIAWLSAHWEKNAWQKYKFLSPYIEGAKERARQLGYRLEEIWAYQPGMTMRRLSQLLYQRGIEGAILSHPARHIRLNWDHVACVSLEAALQAPRLHRVMTDFLFNLMLALKMVKRSGCRRVGICLEDAVNRYSHDSCRAAAHYFQATTLKSDRVPPLFYKRGKQEFGAEQIVLWLQRYRPDVVVGHSSSLVSWSGWQGIEFPMMSVWFISRTMMMWPTGRAFVRRERRLAPLQRSWSFLSCRTGILACPTLP